MSNQTGGSHLLDVLKKKMRAVKDELEQAKEKADEYQKKCEAERRAREAVSLVIVEKHSRNVCVE